MISVTSSGLQTGEQGRDFSGAFVEQDAPDDDDADGSASSDVLSRCLWKRHAWALCL